MAACAQREFTEESGYVLEKVIPLSDNGLLVNGRQTSDLFYPYLGILEEPIAQGSTLLDDTEKLQGLLMPLDEWLTFMSKGQGIELCSVATTYLSLNYLNR